MVAGDGEAISISFSVLGPVQVRWQGRELNLGPRQQRLILALLLAAAGRPVSLSSIVEVLWGQDPPSSAVNVVHRYIGALRRLLEPGLPARSAGRWLRGDASGYRMMLQADQLDLLSMRARAAQARSAAESGHEAEALSLFQDALALWRGPCAGASELGASEHLAFTTIDHECADLARAAADLGLRQNNIKGVLPVLRRMAELRPWDEALQARLLLALSADGHQAAAIMLYQDVRHRLAEDFGVDPGDEFKTAYQLVLRANDTPSVALDKTTDPVRTSPAGPGPKPWTADVPPAQLPADLPHFTGRDEAWNQALNLIDQEVTAHEASPVLSIDGMPGIGKTTLAIHLAHQLAPHYPDGQLYVDLHGFDPEPSIMPPAEALQGFLNALGIPDSDIPATDFARAGLYRSVLARRRILIVIDNARSADQVRPLIPGTPGCLVLITSRLRLTALATTHNAHLLTLDVLPLDEARNFLTTRIGATRTTADPTAVDEIIKRCGRLPLALAIVAGRAQTHPDHQLSDIAHELRTTHGSLDGFLGDDLDNNIRAVFSWSYRLLSPDAARLFRLLALQIGPDLTIPAIASLTATPPHQARQLTGELIRTGLLSEHTPNRFTTHDLTRAYAQELVNQHENQHNRQQATHRLTDHYQRTAYEANLRLSPAVGIDPPEVTGAVVVTEVDTPTAATAWFTANWPALKAVVQHKLDEGDATAAWQLVLSLMEFCQSEDSAHDWAALTRACLHTAARAGDEFGRAHMSRGLAGALHLLGDLDAAERHLDEALELFSQLGCLAEQSVAYRNRGMISLARKDYPTTITYLERALRMAKRIENPEEQVRDSLLLGSVYTEMDQLDKAFELLHQGLLIALENDDLKGLAGCHWVLAEYHHAAGDPVASLAEWRLAFENFRRVGSLSNAVACLISVGDTALALGDRAGARAAWQEGLDLLDLLDRRRLPQTAVVEARLAGLDR
ncbi:AfsR/SARP family transcriptional regulator [Paractinoplanes brasiliensis]|uniref:DNA-binding SARP family transcriptional activator n=1 Tax=Paractinoplanes brasiliensis TaxID=52695 RepID=A0A4R6JR45_9ACTN|nr:BTAD domain-containing putative transcriptional regulator [Actinoplanes brasiliensis]TDO37115.1 DNA-binding SARP family transcriptional activator [Actinoplanes brasiliensis]GID32189.1 SARP family transcriptional regulator [Actinoplanes brasiliensis]